MSSPPPGSLAMASRPALNALPLEIMISIASYLEPVECRNLRLLGRHLAHQLYPEILSEKTLDAASESDLRLFIAMTEPGRPGCFLKSLTLVEKLGEYDEGITRVSSHESEPLDTAEDDSPSDSEFQRQESLDVQASADLLAHAFHNLSQHSESRALSELILQTIDARKKLEGTYKYHYPPFYAAGATGDLHKRALLALQASSLPILALRIAGSNQNGPRGIRENIEERRFVFGCDGLASVVNQINLAPSLGNLKKFSVEFSPSSRPIKKAEEPEGSGPELYWLQATTTRDLEPLLSIFGLLKFCPNLENLSLKGYDAWSVGQVSLLQHIAYCCPLPFLKTCSLDGFGTRNGELLSFLRHHSGLQSLTMIAMYETNEQYANMFYHIATKMPQLQFLHLDDLYERTLHTDGDDEEWYSEKRHIEGIVWFEGSGRGHFPHQKMRGPNTITREGEAVRELIVKKPFLGGRPLGSGRLYIWRLKWQKNYGSFPAQR